MKQIFKKILEILKELFKQKDIPKIPESTNPEESGQLDSGEIEKPKESDVITKIKIAKMIIYAGSKYVGAKERGENTDKGGIIDKIILTMGGKIGHAWCAYFVSYVVTEVCKDLGISYPKALYKGGSSQKFWHKSNIKYILKHADIGCAFVYTYPGQTTNGHIGLCRAEKNSDGSLNTLEGNASDQVALKIQPSRLVKEVSCYVDLPQAIYDQYLLEKKNV